MLAKCPAAAFLQRAKKNMEKKKAKPNEPESQPENSQKPNQTSQKAARSQAKPNHQPESQQKPSQKQAKPARKPSQTSQKARSQARKPEAKPSQLEANQKSQPGFPLRALAWQKQRQISRVIILQPHACTQRFRLRILCGTRLNVDGQVPEAVSAVAAVRAVRCFGLRIIIQCCVVASRHSHPAGRGSMFLQHSFSLSSLQTKCEKHSPDSITAPLQKQVPLMLSSVTFLPDYARHLPGTEASLPHLPWNTSKNTSATCGFSAVEIFDSLPKISAVVRPWPGRAGGNLCRRGVGASNALPRITRITETSNGRSLD